MPFRGRRVHCEAFGYGATISVKYEGATHRLALTNLRSPLDDAKVKVRKKRLVVTLTKRETLLASDAAWPDLFCSAASFRVDGPRRWRTKCFKH